MLLVDRAMFSRLLRSFTFWSKSLTEKLVIVDPKQKYKYEKLFIKYKNIQIHKHHK